MTQNDQTPTCNPNYGKFDAWLYSSVIKKAKTGLLNIKNIALFAAQP